MATIVIIEKHGTMRELRLREYNSEDLYKKCGLRKNTGFEKKTTWYINMDGKEMDIELWAKENGKANSENKYDFPPPVDNKLFYGNCALVRYKDKKVKDLSKELWLKAYEYLFGGFEDLDNLELEDDDEIDELVGLPSSMKTKNGYLKDDFVVDNSNEEEEDDEYEENSEFELDNNKKSSEEYNSEEEDDDSSNSGSELSEEEYCYSSEEN
jgi:hypothetical protein